MSEVIPEAAVEAAVVAIIDAVYGQELPEAPEDLARAALEAAAPHMLAEAWDRAVASMVYDDGTPVEIMSNNNPYRTTK